MMNVLITGATGGLGHSLVMAFAQKGYGLVIHGRDAERLISVRLQAMHEGAAECEMIVGDLRDEQTFAALFAEALEKEVSILVNNAGVYPLIPTSELTPAEIEEAFKVNLIAPIRLALLVYPVFCALGRGLIVNINSLAGKAFNDREALYCASKWGLRGFMGSFRHEARGHNVRILDIYLGKTRTPMTANQDGPMIDSEVAAKAIVHACRDYPTLHINELEIGRRE